MSATAWPSVQRHGLLSTRELIDLFGLDAAGRDRLLNAPRKQSTVLHVDTRALVERHGPRIELCRLNSGAVTHKNHPVRGHRSWLPIADYPYDEYRRLYGRDGALVEVTVLDAVPDILELTTRIEGADGPVRQPSPS